MRDLRTVNMSVGQKAESEKVFKRIGDIDYRNLGTFSKILFNTGKVAVMSGLRVEESSGMTVKIPAGILIQRNSSGENFPVIMTDDILVTMDAASGISRTDIIECQVKSVAVKDDYAQSILDPQTGIISMEPIKRDIKYYLDARKKTGSTTPTAATAASLIGTAEIVSSVDLSSRYIINLIDGEDGNAVEIDLRGATPEATTKAEIVAAINSAIGRTGASVSGNYIAMTGDGTGIQSFFEFKPPVTDTDLDCLDLVFGLGIGGLYSYQYHGSNDWFKICEIDVGAASIVVTNAMIRNIDEKNTWASDASETHIGLSIYNADLLDGYHANTGAVARTVPVRDANGKVPGSITGDADTLDGYHANTGTAAGTIPVRDANGKVPGSITGDADTLDGYHANTGTAAGTIPVRDANGKVPGSITGDADTLDGYHANTGTAAGTVPVRNASGIIPGSISGNAATATRIGARTTADESGWEYATQCPDNYGITWLTCSGKWWSYNNQDAPEPSIFTYFEITAVNMKEFLIVAYTTNNTIYYGIANWGEPNRIWGGWNRIGNSKRGLKNTLYDVTWDISVANGQHFLIHQTVAISKYTAGNLRVVNGGFNTILSSTGFALLCAGQYYAEASAISFSIRKASSQTIGDIITLL